MKAQEIISYKYQKQGSASQVKNLSYKLWKPKKLSATNTKNKGQQVKSKNFLTSYESPRNYQLQIPKTRVDTAYFSHLYTN